MSKLYLMRHGAVAEPWQTTFLGATDVALSPDGAAAIAALAKKMPGYRFSQLICSDLSRCRQTAAIIAAVTGIPVTVEPRLREINMGIWDGWQRSEIKTLWPAEYRRRGNNLWRYRCRGGESFAQVALRAHMAVNNYLEAAPDSLLVTHVGVVRSLLCQYGCLPVAEAFRFPLAYGGILILQRDRTGKMSYNNLPMD